MRIFGIVFLTFIFLGCTKTTKKSSPTVEYVNVEPKRANQLSGDQETKLIQHDSRGYPKVTFIVRLDIFSDAKGNSRDLPQCLQTLDQNLHIGELRCVDGSERSVRVTVGHANQTCYRDPLNEPVKAKKSLNIPKCKASELLIYQFNPHIRVDTEAR